MTAVAQRIPTADTSLASRVLTDRLPEVVDGSDVLVVGRSDRAARYVIDLVERGARVVFAAGGMDPAALDPESAAHLLRLEHERSATLLFRSSPDHIGDVAGLPMAYFPDRRTPDLQFDFVVLSTGEAATPYDIGNTTASHRRRAFTPVIDDLRAALYNATITSFEPTHSDLWVVRVKPDSGEIHHRPGQYASLGLGYWEDRVDDVEEPDLHARWDKLVRRSYSISSPMLSEHGYLTNDGDSGELEFYIVLVAPTAGRVPGLTPRLALKCPGDRLYLGARIAGRYTLDPVTDPDTAVVFLSTGTGEAPHNAMIVELLRKGHTGPIVAAASVRRWNDLGYLDRHRELERRFGNYRYLPMPTREPDVPKRYLQSLIRQGDLDIHVGGSLDPTRTHVYLCGNPSMIGPPEMVDGEAIYPETTGVVELLVERGFTIDTRRTPGNVHFEEYW